VLKQPQPQCRTQGFGEVNPSKRAEIIETVHPRHAPMIPVSTSL
jgi:hypothetical protein